MDPYSKMLTTNSSNVVCSTPTTGKFVVNGSIQQGVLHTCSNGQEMLDTGSNAQLGQNEHDIIIYSMYIITSHRKEQI